MISALRRACAACALAASLAWLPTTPACAQQGQVIAAIVNDDIISSHDLESRISLFLATSNSQDTPENRRRLAPEVLRTLIDDALKHQEMRRQNITVSRAEIDRTLDQIAAQLRVPADQLPGFLASRGVAMSTLIDQLDAEIGWLKVVNRIAGDRVAVSPEEVDAEMAQLRANAGGVEYRVGEIYLAIEDPVEQARVEEQARRLVTEARGGANFAALARTFSQSRSAAVGGDLGWVPRDEMDGQIASVLSSLQPGQVSDPIRAQGGFYILYLADRRAGGAAPAGKVTVSLQQLFLPLSATTATEAEVSAKAKAAQEIATTARTCAEMEERGKRLGSALSRNLGKIDAERLPPDVARAILPLEPGQTTPPVRVAEGFLVLMVCDRQVEEPGAEQRAAIERRLRDQRLSALSRRQLRDLRRGALLDIRM